MTLVKSKKIQCAYFELQNQIISGTLAPNEGLHELEITKKFDCDVGEVRKALQKLEDDGLVKLIPFVGAFVTPISIDEMKDLFHYRCLIEVNALEKVLPLTLADIEVLTDTIELMREAAAANDFESLSTYDMFFHRYLIKRSGKVISLKIWTRLELHMRRFNAYTHQEYFNDLKQIAERHVPILEALISGNIEKVKEEIMDHVIVESIVDGLKL